MLKLTDYMLKILTMERPVFLLEHKNWIVLTYRQLLVWGKVRDFGVDLQLVEVGGMPTDLIAFARGLKGVHAGSLHRPDAGVPKSRVRVLKVKQLVDKNKINLLQGKCTHEQMRSGSRDFDKATRSRPSNRTVEVYQSRKY